MAESRPPSVSIGESGVVPSEPQGGLPAAEPPTGDHVLSTIAPTAGESSATSQDWTRLRLPGDAPEILGEYELLEAWEGGMGIVYRARHRKVDRIVALKTMRPEYAAYPEQVQRFEREVRALAKLGHRHIAPVYEIHLEGPRPYFTMAFFAGGSLAQRRQQFCEPRRAATVVEKIARAIQHAHEHQIFHRDLKPGNILLDEEGEPAVSDFGLAKFRDLDIELTRTGAVVGTIPYMPPEQAEAKKDIGAGADIWALGVILYELIAGVRPFTGENSEDLRQNIIHRDPLRLSKSRSGIDRSLEAIVLKCLAKDPARRYGTAGELANDLESWLKGDTPKARPELMLARLWRKARRHWRIVWAVVAIVSALALLPVVLYLKQPDAGAYLWPINWDLRRGHSVTLVGEGGMPRWHRWLWEPGILSDQTFIGLDRSAARFSIQAGRPVFLELLRDPQTTAYSFQAEVCQHSRPSNSSQVGIWCADTGNQALDVVWLLSFNDCLLGPDGKASKDSVGYLAIMAIQKEGWGGTPRQFVKQFPFASSDPANHVWHKLRIEVKPAMAQAFWDDQGVFRLDMEGAAAQQRLMIKGLTESSKDVRDLKSQFAARGGLGLYVTAGEGAFRNVMVQPKR
jgi:tRNA A-37 threonylcarbamoyl transferase component Bud32